MPLNSSYYTVATSLLLAGLVAAAIYLGLQMRWTGTAELLAAAILILIFSSITDRLPRIFNLLFALAAAVNAMGWVFNLWSKIVYYDDFVHALTSSSLSASFGWLLFSRTSVNAAGRERVFIGYVTAFAVIAGAAWEGVEWAFGIIGTTWDTVADLILDTIGGIVAGAFCAWAANRERKERAHGR